MNFIYQCSQCQKKYKIDSNLLMVCPSCYDKNDPGPMNGVLEVIINDFSNKKKIANLNSFDFSPIEKKYFPNLPVGETPLITIPNICKKMGFKNLFIKDDSFNLSGSYKDRASILVAAFAKKFKIKNIVLASTGNAASSMSAIGAATNINVKIFVPKSAPSEKIIQSRQYGAEVILVDGTYDLAYKLSLFYSEKYNYLNRNTAYNPMTIEGKKTSALEIVQQVGVPDNIFIPTGDGAILAGVYKGFEDLYTLKITSKIPKVFAVQSEKSAAIYNYFSTGTFNSVNANTIADSLSVNTPQAAHLCYKKLKLYDGDVITVSDHQILEGQKYLSQNSGIFSEPAGATAFAGFYKLKDKLNKNATTIILSTGTGLKDIKSANKILTSLPSPIKTI